MRYRISLNSSSVSFESSGEVPVLESALESAVFLSHSCKTGRCEACSAVIKSGSVKKGDGDVIESGQFLTCNSYPLSDLHIEAPYFPELAEFKPKSIPCKVE